MEDALDSPSRERMEHPASNKLESDWPLSLRRCPNPDS